MGFGNALFIQGIENKYRECVKTNILWIFLVSLRHRSRSSAHKKALYRAKSGFVLVPSIGSAHTPLPKGEWSVAESTTFMEYLCNEKS